jgi:hypothetical protein
VSVLDLKPRLLPVPSSASEFELRRGLSKRPDSRSAEDEPWPAARTGRANQTSQMDKPPLEFGWTTGRPALARKEKSTSEPEVSSHCRKL